jgi:hypothetical protein
MDLTAGMDALKNYFLLSAVDTLILRHSTHSHVTTPSVLSWLLLVRLGS